MIPYRLAMTEKRPKKNPAAQALGRLGGAATSPKKTKAARANAKLGGRPRRVCTECNRPVHGGHKDAKDNARCSGRTWTWQSLSEKRSE